MKLRLALILALLASATFARAQCTVSPSTPAVPAGGSQTFTKSGGCGSGTWAVAGSGGGSIDSSTGVYTAPSTVTPGSYSRGCQLGPNNSVFVQPISGLSPTSFTQWLKRIQTQPSNSGFHTTTPGLVSQFDNVVNNSTPKQTYFFFEEGGRGTFSGQQFFQPLPPDLVAQQGWSMQISAGFDNHVFAINKDTCEDDEIYKPYLDYQTYSFVAGNPTVVNFTTDTLRVVQTPLQVYAEINWTDPAGLFAPAEQQRCTSFLYPYCVTQPAAKSGPLTPSGSCPTGLLNTGNPWWATITSQPASHGGTGQLTIPFNSTGMNVSGCQITSVDETGGTQTIGPPGDNAQSGAIFPVNSNALISGSNAIASPISRIAIHMAELYNNVANSQTCNNADSGKVLGWCHAGLFTLDNRAIAPVDAWPSINGTNVTGGHPDIYPTAGTNASAAKFTLTTDGCSHTGFFECVQPCSGNPQFSGNWESDCPVGHQFDVVFQGCTGGWSALNGNHYVGTTVQGGDTDIFTIPVDSTGFGSFPAGACYFYFDWMPYGSRIRLQSSFNCETICSGSSLTTSCPYEKAACRSLQTYGAILTDGTIPSDSFGMELVSSEFDPDFLHDVLDNDAQNNLWSLLPNPRTHIDIVDESSLNLNGPGDGATSGGRVTVTFTGSGGTGSTDLILQGTSVGCSRERLGYPAISGNTYQMNCWVTGDGTSSGLTYSMSPSVSGASVNSSGLITPPNSVASETATIISVCSVHDTTACDHVQVFFLPVDGDGVMRYWVGGEDLSYTDSNSKVWWGAYTARNWQSNYEIAQYINFASLFGTWKFNSGNWGTDGKLYGESASVVNDPISWYVLPAGSYGIEMLGEPGYNTTRAGECVFDLEAQGNILSSYNDCYSLAGGLYRGYTLGPYEVSVGSDNTLELAQRVRVYVGAQAEGTVLSAWRITPGAQHPQITTASLPQGEKTVSYSATLNAQYGTAPYTWSISAGSLPTGLSLTGGCSTLSCTITGTPTASGTSSFTVQVCDTNSLCGTAPLSITVVTTLTITTSSLPNGQVGQAYSSNVLRTGGIAPFTWSISAGSLPTGLSITGNPSGTATIAGTPTLAGTYNFTVKVVDANSISTTQALSIQINGTASLTVTTTSLPAGTVNSFYSAGLAASGGSPPYTWAVTVGSLPTGLGLSGSTISGTPSTAGTSNFTVQVTDQAMNTATAPLSITINNPTLVITTTSLPAGTVGVAYSFTLSATGGSGPLTWSVLSGGAPGLSLNSGGVLSGTPTNPGNFNIDVQVADTHSNVASQNFVESIIGSTSVYRSIIKGSTIINSPNVQ